MKQALRWAFGLVIGLLVTVVPFMYYRAQYTHAKRLRVVEPGELYRSGQMSVAGFTEAIRQYGIRTVINCQDEYPDPDLYESYLQSYFSGRTTKESEVCRRLGVRYVYIPPDLLPRSQARHSRPEAIDKFLAIMDDPANHPVLLHCHAGLHRTGILNAVFRMEYHGWTPLEAILELKANGFGEFPCTASNDYITQYILSYHPRIRNQGSGVRSQESDTDHLTSVP